MSRPCSSPRRFSPKTLPVWFALLLFLPSGCASVGSTPIAKNGLMRFPGSGDAAFEERVQADPFPSANQALGNSLKSRTL